MCFDIYNQVYTVLSKQKLIYHSLLKFQLCVMFHGGQNSRLAIGYYLKIHIIQTCPFSYEILASSIKLDLSQS